MRLKSCRPSPWCIQSDWAEKSFTYMPSRPAGTSVVFASEYWRVMPSQAVQVEAKDLVVCPERMQLRPAIEVLERVVGPVVRAPTQEDLEIAALRRSTSRRTPGTRDVVGKELALEPRPGRAPASAYR